MGLVKKLLELEIPEIANGTVEIKSIVREAGLRTKVAVSSNDPNLDAVGACIGNRGVRINEVINEVGGEKIDVIEWSDDPAVYITRAMSPAPVSRVELNPIDKTSIVVVPDNKFSLAIGKNGHNVRLAVRLTDWKIDLKAESAMPKFDEPKEEVEKPEGFDDLFTMDSTFDDLDE